MNKKAISYWALYDFANSLVLMAFLFYFSQWLVIEEGNPAWWYNVALIMSSALFIITAPFLSGKIDSTNRKIEGLRLWTGFTFVGYLSVALITVFSDALDLLATVLYAASTYAYLICFLYFTPMLNDLSTKENLSWVSGLGQSANSIGQVAGVLITLPFVNGITLFGDPGRAQALFPAVILFGILALPMLLFYKDKAHAYSDDLKKKRPLINFFSSLKLILANKPLAFFLLAYFLFSDAMLTFANNFPLYLETVHGVSDTIKSLLTASILILAAVGSLVFGKIADKKGGIKTLKLIIIAWCVLFVVMAMITKFSLLIPIFLVAGVLFGPVWGISRSIVGQLAPQGEIASSYSYYVVAERFATFVGPAIWSGALIVAGEGTRGYQTALFSLSIILIISLFAFKKVRDSSVALN